MFIPFGAALSLSLTGPSPLEMDYFTITKADIVKED
jgi:hypothetical protein